MEYLLAVIFAIFFIFIVIAIPMFLIIMIDDFFNTDIQGFIQNIFKGNK